ncbi:putative beta-lactamase superfamily domain containing protein [Lyophyllum shimeji]|uniref:Beta-lactamase superfamily domain containing protein n=1 Tax=Lyophyllum shimeji TaxID=47721 RepID=A0A9P3UJA8_LYOSH|nr:putative beta-lactamase superfamily domain containing protein [Lyophyllum shimeji]
MMQGAFRVTFLGTSSGGGPSESRNCSSLVCDVVGDGTLWMVDCAEGTNRQFAFQDRSSTNLRSNKVTKMFITHMHADHIMGIIPFLRNILYPPPVAKPFPVSKPPAIEIYGPCGIRAFVRQVMKMTCTRTADFWTVHELLTPTDRKTPCLPHSDAADSTYELDVMHKTEVAGRDIMCSEDGFWKAFTVSQSLFGELFVDAGPISHRDPCLGYVIREAAGPMRKLVILGDTSDASAIIPLCVNPPPSLLVHEATDAHIPRHVDYNATRTPEAVLDKALSRGHSIPSMAGAFAKSIGAERLVLNHIGGRFPAPKYARDRRTAVMKEIEKQATQAWGSKTRAIAAYDFMQVIIPPVLPTPREADTESDNEESNEEERGSPMDAIQTAETVTMQLHHADPNEGFLYASKKRGRGDRDRRRRR